MIIFYTINTFTGGIRIGYRLIRDQSLAPIREINDRVKILLIEQEMKQSFIEVHISRWTIHYGYFDDDEEMGRK